MLRMDRNIDEVIAGANAMFPQYDARRFVIAASLGYYGVDNMLDLIAAILADPLHGDPVGFIKMLTGSPAEAA